MLGLRYLILLSVVTLIDAWIVDDSCLNTFVISHGRNENIKPQVEAAVTEAVNMAEFAKFVMNGLPGFTPPQGLIDDLLGTDNANPIPGRQAFINLMNRVSNNVGGTTPFQPGFTGPFTDDKLIIYCGTAHLQPAPNDPSAVIDTNFQGSNKGTNLDPSTGLPIPPCGPGVRALGYQLHDLGVATAGKPRYSIVLCDTATPSAGTNIVALTPEMGKLSVENNWRGFDINDFQALGSRILLHEIVHSAGEGTIPFVLDETNNIKTFEISGVGLVDGLQFLDNNLKQKNADGYALLATMMYCRKTRLQPLAQMIADFGVFEMGSIIPVSEWPPVGPHPHVDPFLGN